MDEYWISINIEHGSVSWHIEYWLWRSRLMLYVGWYPTILAKYNINIKDYILKTSPYRLSSTVINLLLLTPWQAFIKSHQTHIHYTHKNSNTNTQMEIQKKRNINTQIPISSLLVLTPWQAFIKSHQTHLHYTHKYSNTNTQMEIQKREIEIHKYRYPSAVFWCWLPGRCLLTKSAKLPILLLISPCDLHRHHDKDFGNIMLTIVTLEGKIINMYSSENKLAKLWQMQPNWYPSSQQPII